MMPPRVGLPTACPSPTYSVAIRCSFSRCGRAGAVDLGAWLWRTVEASLWWRLASHDDRGGQAPALVVARARAVPVVPRAVELEGRLALRMVHQPDELVVAVAREHRAVRVLVIVDERELERSSVGHDQDAGLVHELVLRDPDRGAHDAVGSLLSLSDGSTPEDSTERHPVLVVQLGYVDGSVAHGSSLASIGQLLPKGLTTAPFRPTRMVCPRGAARSESPRRCCSL